MLPSNNITQYTMLSYSTISFLAHQRLLERTSHHLFIRLTSNDPYLLTKALCNSTLLNVKPKFYRRTKLPFTRLTKILLVKVQPGFPFMREFILFHDKSLISIVFPQLIAFFWQVKMLIRSQQLRISLVRFLVQFCKSSLIRCF